VIFKKITMKKIYMLAIGLLYGVSSFAQCASTGSYGTATAPTNYGDISAASPSCAYSGEAATFNNVVAGDTYEVSYTGGTGNYITVYDATNTAVAFGDTPITFTAATSGSFTSVSFISSLCDTENSCHQASWEKTGPIPTCLTATALNVTGLTSTSAILNWTDATAFVDYNWEIQPQGTAQGTAGAISGTGANTGVTAGGLTESTDYDVFVQTNCGGSDYSAWAGPISFSTLCAVITPDYNEDFTTYLNPCWSEAKGLLGTTNTTMTSTSSNWTSDGFGNVGSNGSARMEIYATNRKEWLISPSIDLGISANFQLEFDVALTEWNNTNASTFGADDTLAVVISTDNGVTWNTTNILQLWTAGSEPSTIGDNIIIDLSTYTGIIKIGFYAASSVSGGDINVYIDNFWVRTPPACADASGLNVSNITDSDVVLNWTNSVTGSAVDYNWEIQPQGTAQGTAGAISGSGATSGVTAAGLSESTDYDVFIQTNCAGPLSTWVGPISFTTPCSAVTPDYNEDFTSYLNPCWSEAKGLLSATNTTMTATSSNWISDGFANVGTSGAAKMNIYSTGRKEWLISPSIDLGIAGNLQLEFDIALTDYASTNATVFGADDTLAVVISTDNGVTWNTSNILQSWGVGSEPSHTGDNIIIDLSSYTGIVKIGFYAASSVSNEDNDLSIDNFWVRTPPACSVPTALNVTTVTTTSAVLNWTNSLTGTAVDYNWEIQPQGTAQGTAGAISGTGASTGVTANGLSSSTNYDVFVQTNCGTPQSLWVGPISFYTGHCIPSPTSVDNLGITNVTMGTINNTTGTETNNYGDYTTMIANAAQGATFNIDITLETGYDYDLFVWVDWNDDLDFDDAGEGYYLGEAPNPNPTTFNGSITIPSAASIGNHRIRIGGSDSGLGNTLPADACYSGSYATFEDYTLNITAPILVTSITVQGQGGVSTITTNAGTLQMEATVLPANATDTTYTWSVVNGTGAATIDATGLLTASADGDVTVTATANDASGLSGDVVITISNQIVLVSSITVQGLGGVSTITTNAGTLQMEATVLPANVTDGTYTWSVVNGTGAATIDAAGLLTASADGDVTVTATANDASGLTGDAIITISNQDILVSSITVQGQSGVSTITTNAGTLQMEATVLPANATDGTYTWSVVNGTGAATIDATGLLTASADGDVTVTATANDASGLTGDAVITISNQDILVTSITVQGQGGVSTITLDDGTLQMEATVLPANATDGTYTWSLANGTGQATIDAAGLLTATHNGDVTVTATANDASGVAGTAVITITNQTSVGVNENGNLNISIFPNPTQAFVNILSDVQINSVNIYNVAGKLIMTDKAENNIINIKDLANGSYIIVINTINGLNHTSRFVKQ